jgi:integrase
MASIFRRGQKLWVKLKVGGEWVNRPTPYAVGQEDLARRYAKRKQQRIEERQASGRDEPLTVKRYARTWLDRRRERHDATRKRFEATGKGTVEHRDWQGDESRMRAHVLGSPLGSMKLADVRAKHLADFVHRLRTTSDLSPHTVANVYGLLVSMFRSAAVAGLVETSPCILTRTELGSDDGDTDGAGRYTREQLVLMLSSPKLPEHARVFAGLGGMAGLRLGAIAGLRWSDLDESAAPLWRLTSARTYDDRPTKTGKPSIIPVHLVLAGMLEEWREGWEQLFGRPPTGDDPIVPRAPGKRIDKPGAPHTKKTGGDLMDLILVTLGIAAAPMKSHALRSTFISIALEDGARDDLIERITHTTGKKRRAFDRYDRADYWPQLCAEVTKIRIRISPESRDGRPPLGTRLGTRGHKPRGSMGVWSGGAGSRSQQAGHEDPPTAGSDSDGSIDGEHSRTERVPSLGTRAEEPSGAGDLTQELAFELAHAVLGGDQERARALAEELLGPAPDLALHVVG